MAKFITGKDLEQAIYDIIWEAKNTLLIVSPFIRLDNYFRRLFDNHLSNERLHIIIVFGKNEGDISRSLSHDDFEYFKRFPNISVIYIPELHAKYYGNEHKGVITSINLYDHSFKNNIEFGVYSETNLIYKLSNTTDKEAWNTCLVLASENEAVFIRRPAYHKKLFSKKFIHSLTLHDDTKQFYTKGFHPSKKSTSETKLLNDFPDEVDLGNAETFRPTRVEVETSIAEESTISIKHFKNGFCIRTGTKIPFNIDKPFSKEGYKMWNITGDEQHPEKYCHFSGEESFGATTFERPILKKNWKKAQELQNNN